MKKLVMLMATILVGAFGLAGAATLSKTTVASAFKTKSHSGIQLTNDMNIVYTGQDVYEKHAGVEQLAIA